MVRFATVQGALRHCYYLEVLFVQELVVWRPSDELFHHFDLAAKVYHRVWSRFLNTLTEERRSHEKRTVLFIFSKISLLFNYEQTSAHMSPFPFCLPIVLNAQVHQRRALFREIGLPSNRPEGLIFNATSFCIILCVLFISFFLSGERMHHCFRYDHLSRQGWPRKLSVFKRSDALHKVRRGRMQRRKLSVSHEQILYGRAIPAVIVCKDSICKLKYTMPGVYIRKLWLT